MKSYVLIQVDCDGEYVLSSHYGEKMSKEKEYDVFYTAINFIVSLLKKYSLKATFFVVGRDLEDANKVDILRNVVAEGHEIANHTYTHPNGLSKMSISDIQSEISETNRIISKNLAIEVYGFRAPNFDISNNTLNILEKNKIIYDCSILDTPWKPMFRALKGLDIFSSSYLGRMFFLPSSKNIIEIPVSTFPYIKFPCNLSYMLALPELIAPKYFQMLYKYYLEREKTLVLVLHLSDFVDNVYLFRTEAKYFKSLRKRLFFIEDIFKILSNSFKSTTTIDYVNEKVF